MVSTLLFFHKPTVDVVPILNDFHRERLQELPQVENVYDLFRFKAQQIPSQAACGYRRLLKEVMEKTANG